MLKILTTLLLILNLHAQDIYTVDELILQALNNSPDLKISSAQYKASQSRYDQAFASYLPKIDLLVSGSGLGISDYTDGDNMVTDTLLLGKLSLEQLLYDFGKTGNKIDKLRHDSGSLLNSNEQQISDKKMSVKQAYYEVLRAVALIEVHKENVKLNESQLYRSQKYFDAGIKTKIDVSDAKVELIKSSIDLKKGLYDLKLAYASLDRVVGFVEIDRNYKVYTKKLILIDIYQSLNDYGFTLSDSINFAYKNRYEIKKYLLNTKSAISSSKSTSSEYFPQLSISADYTKQDTDKFESSLPDDQWQASINLNWNIYQGGTTSASIQEKKIQISMSHAELENSKLSIKKETTQAFINVYKMKDSVKLAQNLLEVSQEKFDQAQKRYEHGLSDYIELQQARQGYIDAKSSLVIDYYNYYDAIAVLDKAIGK